METKIEVNTQGEITDLLQKCFHKAKAAVPFKTPFTWWPLPLRLECSVD